MYERFDSEVEAVWTCQQAIKDGQVFGVVFEAPEDRVCADCGGPTKKNPEIEEGCSIPRRSKNEYPG